jgi:hypothetical protein
MEVLKAAKAAQPQAEPQGARLLSAEETTALRAKQEESVAAGRALFGGGESSGGAPASSGELDADSVFAKLKSLKSDRK